MTRLFPAALLALLAALAAPLAAQDAEGLADHPAIGRYAGATLVEGEIEEYGIQTMYVSNDPETYEDFEGGVTRLVYDLPEGVSILQVLRSYEEELEAEGFETLVSCLERACTGGVGRLRATAWGRLLNLDHAFLTVAREEDGREIHAQVIVTSTWVNVNVVESGTFENAMVDAEGLSSTLAAEGRMALYDIHFATGSAEITEDSLPVIGVIAEALAGAPELSIIVVGHTDNVGGLEDNLALSRNRAQAVVDRLVADFGVAAERVTGAGVGYLAPVSTNATAEGRALNRRVEIVVR
ncbi:OmpA family protein [Pseudoroseicyclus sp. CXY001]|uniref:OmpA family protein n=1 Tax=Pseudoroseicyclus sp. CXY001 TaxID=3242492 RepID=UPI003570AD20